MSHRDRVKKYKDRLPPRPKPTAPPPVILPVKFDAKAGTDIVGEIDHVAAGLESGREQDLYAMMNRLDTDKEILKHLDREAVNAIPQDKRGDAFRAFNAALWTWLARHKDLLKPLVDCNLVRFGMEPYRKLIPAIGPISDDVPTFNVLFLGHLQDAIKDRFLEIGALPARHLDADAIPPEGKLAPYGLTDAETKKITIPLEDYFEITHGILEEYIQARLAPEPEAASRLAGGYISYVFIWLGSLSILQDIISRLACGNPLVRKVERPDGTLAYVHGPEGKPPKGNPMTG